ncbi:MAG: peptidase E [Gemmatales bacterium]|nr:MAG: peptidase E [Gemmatales bacterium]
MMLRLLLGSGGYRTPERVALLTREMRSFFGDIHQLLFVPYALGDHDAYLNMVKERGLDAGYQIIGIHHTANPRQAVENAEAIFIGGGNSFRLLDSLYQFDLIEVIRQRVQAGMPYLGISAGTNVACPTIMTTNDMPIVMPPSLQALNLVPFQINPHYFNLPVYLKDGDNYLPHFGETRDERIGEFHETNDVPVVGLWEAGMIRIEGASARLIGTGARLFRKGCEPIDLQPGADLSDLWQCSGV